MEKLIKTIDLDCPPQAIRPSDLIGGVIKGTGLTLKEPVSKCFGNFKWDYSEVPDEEWLRIKPILKTRITELFNKGIIRYGSW